MTTPQTPTLLQPAPLAVMQTCLLDVLRAEMGALQAILPGFAASAANPSEDEDAAFDNMPV